jgi:hypothetical protein
MNKRELHFQRISECKQEWKHRSSERLRHMLLMGAPSKEQAIAIRELLEERGETVADE